MFIPVLLNLRTRRAGPATWRDVAYLLSASVPLATPAIPLFPPFSYVLVATRQVILPSPRAPK